MTKLPNPAKTIWNFLFSFCWAAKTYFRGAVLRQSAYQPVIDERYVTFRDLKPPSYMSMKFLMYWWGSHPLDLEEATRFYGCSTIGMYTEMYVGVRMHVASEESDEMIRY